MNDIDSKNIYTQLGLNSSQESQTKANDELGQAEFLELMTAQLKFQDPLKPMENGEFLGQMAQFGTVSGINDLNTTFSTMSASFQSNQALQASTMVGRRVLVPSDAGLLNEGNSLFASVELEQPVNRLVLSIKNQTGQLVHRKEFGQQSAGLVDFEWNGLDADGNRLAAGEYQISAEVHRGTEVSSGTMFTLADVESVTLGAGGQDLTLSVAGLGDFGMGQVRKIL